MSKILTLTQKEIDSIDWHFVEVFNKRRCACLDLINEEKANINRTKSKYDRACNVMADLMFSKINTKGLVIPIECVISLVDNNTYRVYGKKYSQYLINKGEEREHSLLCYYSQHIERMKLSLKRKEIQSIDWDSVHYFNDERTSLLSILSYENKLLDGYICEYDTIMDQLSYNIFNHINTKGLVIPMDCIVSLIDNYTYYTFSKKYSEKLIEDHEERDHFRKDVYYSKHVDVK